MSMANAQYEYDMQYSESDHAQRLTDAATHAADCVASDLEAYGVAIDIDHIQSGDGLACFLFSVDAGAEFDCEPDELLRCIRDWFARGVKKCDELLQGDKGTEACRLLLSTIEGDTYGLSESEQLAAIRAAACAAKELIEK